MLVFYQLRMQHTRAKLGYALKIGYRLNADALPFD